MNYPTAIKKTYKKQINYGNRGMDLENFINQTNEYYLENDIAVIYKKPTPIQVVKYNYDNKRKEKSQEIFSLKFKCKVLIYKDLK